MTENIIDEEKGQTLENTDVTESPARTRSLFEEAAIAIDVAASMYGLADLRRFARHGQLYDGDPEKNATLLEFPTNVFDIFQAMYENKDFLMEELGEEIYNMYLSLETLKKGGDSIANLSKYNLKNSEIILMDDVNSETECVYALALDHEMKDIMVGFRGSVTVRDWQADLKDIMKECENPVPLKDAQESGIPHSPSIAIHKGFREYLDSIVEKTSFLFRRALPEERESPVTKCQRLLEELALLSVQYPNYDITVSGHSLGGALATVFALEAAASTDERIRKPITCVSVASPKVGNVRFLHAVQALETKKHLRFLRVANFGDAVTVLPDPGYINSLLRPERVYRHVGLTLKMYPSRYHAICGTLELGHVGRYHGWVGYLNQLYRSIKHLFVCIFATPFLCACCCCFGQLFLVNHGCLAYVHRLKMNKEILESITLDEVYERDLKIKRCRM